MGNPSFFTEYLKDAQTAAAQCPGMLVSVILAQWADETDLGSSPQFVAGNNYAGVSIGGGVNTFPSKAAGLAAYVQTLNLPYYNAVRAAGTSGWQAQCVALGESPWAGGHYDWADYSAGRPIANPGIDLISIVNAYALTQYDTAPTAKAAAAASTGTTTAGSSVDAFRSAYPQVAPPAPGFTSDINTDDIVINGQTLDLIINNTGDGAPNAVVTVGLDFAIDKASVVAITIHDPDRTIINSPVFSQASLLEFPGTSDSAPLMFQLASLEKEGSVLTASFEAYIVAALRQQTGAFTVPPGTMTRVEFAQLLVTQIEDASFLAPPPSYLASLKEGYTGLNKEQLSRGTMTAPLEDSWTCLQRLANEIQWVCFESFNVVYFGPYSWLASQQAVFAPREFYGGVDTIDGTWDVGQPLSEMTVTCYADSWAPTVGQAVAINDLGPFGSQGNWIVKEMEREDCQQPDMTVTIMLPLPGLPEPSTGGAKAAVGSGAGNVQSTGGSQQAQAALNFCKSKIGLPYIYGGTGPSGYDCSGLVYEAYLSVGINITRTTYTEWPSAAGQPVPAGINNLLPGDLVYFGPELGQPAEHVAIVDTVNKGSNTVTVVEAPHTGADVQYSTMNPDIGAPYGNTLVYLGALRPAP